MRKKTLWSILILLCLTPTAAVSARSTRGVLRPDLVGKLWHQLPPTRYPGFRLPMPWKANNKYEYRLFKPDFGKYIVTIAELLENGNRGDALIVSAVDFSTLKKGYYPEQDCFYKDVPPCDGMLCEGLLIGVITQNEKSKDGTFVPTEVWKITSKSLQFEKVSSKNVVCKPQSYAE